MDINMNTLFHIPTVTLIGLQFCLDEAEAC